MNKKRDLVILAADKQIEQTVIGLFSNPAKLGIHPIQFTMLVHPKHDPGCYKTGHDLLRIYVNQFEKALILFDYQGSGLKRSIHEIEQEVNHNLEINGWSVNRAKAIVIEPELEKWVWFGDSILETLIGWDEAHSTIKNWLIENRLWQLNHEKPLDPKRALEDVLRFKKKPRSAALYRQLAQSVKKKHIDQCTDTAFQKLIATLQIWFPKGSFAL